MNAAQRSVLLSAGAVTPRSILGAALVGWWNADSAGKITTTGSGVSSWLDEIGGYDLSQATDAARPVWSPTSFNGRGGVTFDGVDDFLRLVGVPSTFPVSNSPGEIWICGSQDALGIDGVTRYGFSYGGTSASVARATRRSISGGNNRASYQAGGIVSSNAAEFSGRHTIRHVFDGTNLRADQDGAVGTSNTVSPGTGTTHATLGGSYAVVPGNLWQGNFHQILVLSANPTAAQVIALNALFATRVQ